VREIFRDEIDELLSRVPADVRDAPLRRIHYDYQPWHPLSFISFRCADEWGEGNPAEWRYFQVALTDCSRLGDVIEAYGDDRLNYHHQLVEAAAALLDIDTTRYGLPPIVVEPDGFLRKLFVPEVTDFDKTLEFNYCEYVLANRLKGR